MRKSHKILTAVAVAGIAFAGGSAFTGTGLTTTVDASQFIGGQVSQTVTGATLSGVDYDFTDTAQGTVNGINLSFAGDTPDGAPVTVTPKGVGGGTFDCTAVSTGASPSTSTCTFIPSDEDETGYTGLTGLDITVGTLDTAG